MSFSKIIKFLLCLLGGLFLFVNMVKAETNPYPKNQTINGITTVSCTWFAWQEAYEKTGIELPRWGNAVNWYKRASIAGYDVGSEPRANSIVVWQNSSNVYGHVAYVTNVNGTTMTVNEGGVTTLVVNKETNEIAKVPYNSNGIYYGNVLSISNKRSETSFLLGFIYLNNEEERLNNQNNEFEELVLIEENIEDEKITIPENNTKSKESFDKQQGKEVVKQEKVNNNSILESNKEEIKQELDDELSDKDFSKVNHQKTIEEPKEKEIKNKKKFNVTLKKANKEIKQYDNIAILRSFIVMFYTILLVIIKSK